MTDVHCVGDQQCLLQFTYDLGRAKQNLILRGMYQVSKLQEKPYNFAESSEIHVAILSL